MLSTPSRASRRVAAAVLLALLASRGPAQDPDEESWSERGFAFVVHYDGTHVNLNSVLLSSVVASHWPAIADRGGLPEDAAEALAIVRDAGPQPPGAYSGRIFLTLPDSLSRREQAAIARSALTDLEHRLAELLVTQPLRDAKRALEELEDQLQEATARWEKLVHREPEHEVVARSNPEHRDMMAQLANAELTTAEQETGLEVLHQQQAELAARMDELHTKHVENYDQLQQLQEAANTTPQNNPDLKGIVRKLAEVRERQQRLAAEADRAQTSSADIQTEIRNRTMQLTQAKMRVAQFRARLAAVPAQIEEKVPVKDPVAKANAASLAEEIRRLSDARRAARQALHQVVRPRVVPWF